MPLHKTTRTVHKGHHSFFGQTKLYTTNPSVLPSNHGGVLLDSCLQQPLQNGPFSHGDGTMAEMGLGERPLLPSTDSFLCLTGPACACLHQQGLHWTPVPHQLPPPDLYTSTWPGVSPVSVIVFCWARPAVLPPPLGVEEVVSWMPPPSSFSLDLFPLPSAVMLVLPLQHHSVLHYSICYSSLYDSHDCPLFSTGLFLSPTSSLLSRPPPYPPITSAALCAIEALLHLSLHCMHLPFLQPCLLNINTHHMQLILLGSSWQSAL